MAIHIQPLSGLARPTFLIPDKSFWPESKIYLGLAKLKLGVVDKQISVYLGSPKLWLRDGTMAPLDYKYTVASQHEVVFKTHQMQIRMYAWLVQEIYQTKVNKGFVAYIRGPSQLHEVPVLPEHFEEIALILDEIFTIIKTGQLPKRTPKRNHCVDCCYKNICV